MELGKNLKKYRENNQMTQKEIAEILNVEPATISKYESGILEPKIESLKKISKIFEITIDELLKDEKDNVNVSNIDILKVLKEQKEMKIKDSLYHNTQIAFAYNTNNIHKETLSKEQTKTLYENNTIFFENKTNINADDIIEILNHFKLMNYILDIANKDITENMIKKLHKMLKAGTSEERNEDYNIGEYKKFANEAVGMKTISPKDVQKNMDKLLNWYNSLNQVTLKKIVNLYAVFEKIHPFQTGNGKIARLIVFKECLKNNIVPFFVLEKDKLEYFNALKKYQDKEKEYLINIFEKAQNQYINLMQDYLK